MLQTRTALRLALGGLLVSACGLALADGSAASNGAKARYYSYLPPSNLGQDAFEPSSGYNPLTGHAFFLSTNQTLRITFPERLPEPLPESCDALYEDVTATYTSAYTNDPILHTDQVTGRTFVSQLILGPAGQSFFAYTDDDGANWSPVPATLSGGVDHQTVGTGPYPKSFPIQGTQLYPHAVYYCSHSIEASFCVRSDDGGLSFGPPGAIKVTPAQCVDANDATSVLGALHGHVKVAPDGAVYVPDKACGPTQMVSVSEDAGTTWTIQHIPNSTVGASDPVVAIATDNTAYVCYINGEGDVHAVVTKDHGKTWINDVNLSERLGLANNVLPVAAAGDGDRAACAWHGTQEGGNFQALDYPGVWYPYIAHTYDGGKNWEVANLSPDDPVQGVGGICFGTTCGKNRNFGEFNEMNLDEKGRPVYGYSDGCTGGCVQDPTRNPFAQRTTLVRMSGGKSLFAAFDGEFAGNGKPAAACVGGQRGKTKSWLKWRAPDDGGNAISRYRVFRAASRDGLYSQIGETGATGFNDEAGGQISPYFYKVSALNSAGESVASNIIELAVGEDPVVQNACALPGVTVMEDTQGDSRGGVAQYDILSIALSEPTDNDGKLVVTLKVGSLSPAPPPDSRWAVNLGAPDGNTYFVAMTTAGGTPRYTWGTVSSIDVPAAPVGSFTEQGTLEDGSGNTAEGVITLIIDKSKLGAPAAGELLTVSASTRTTPPNEAGVSGVIQDDTGANTYALRPAAGCFDPNTGKLISGAQTAAQAVADHSRFGGALNLVLLLPLFGFRMLRRQS